MATSGSFDWEMTRDEIIEDALQDLGQLGHGQTASAAQMAEGVTVLNKIIKSLQAEGMRLWTLVWGTQPLTASSVVLGTDGSNYTCIKGHTSSSDTEPVTGPNWTTYWKQEGTGGIAWVDITVYTSIGEFTLPADTVGIDKIFIRDITNIDIRIRLISRHDYMDLSTKATLGTPTRAWYEPQLDGSNKVYLYPYPDTDTDVIHFHRMRKLEDMDAAGNTLDFPVRWTSAIQAGLVFQLAPKYGYEVQMLNYLEAKAERLLQKAKDGDSEQVNSLQIKPDLRGGMR